MKSRLRNAVLHALRAIDRLLQVMVPPRRHQVAWLSDPDYSGNSYHLFRHALRTRPGLDHVWLVDDAVARERIAADLESWRDAGVTGTVRLVKRSSLRGYWAYVRSKWVFHTHGVYRWVNSAVRRQSVSLWHGMPIKAIGALNTISPNPHATFGTLHVATSPAYREIIARAFRASERDVLLTSLPRCDVLQQRSPLAPPEDRIRSALDIAPDRRFVLWMPTYRTSIGRAPLSPGIAGPRTFLDDVPDGLWRDLDSQAGQADVDIVLKLHPMDVLNEAEFDPVAHWGLEHVRLVSSAAWGALGVELYDVLAVTDALITDVSSVMIDWMLTDRPLGTVGFDLSTYTRDVVIDVDRLYASRRLLQLDQRGAVEEFFSCLHGDSSVSEDEALTNWLHLPRLDDGCETVLEAVGVSS